MYCLFSIAALFYFSILWCVIEMFFFPFQVSHQRDATPFTEASDSTAVQPNNPRDDVCKQAIHGSITKQSTTSISLSTFSFASHEPAESRIVLISFYALHCLRAIISRLCRSLQRHDSSYWLCDSTMKANERKIKK